jgi:Tfp pilus assembly protein PilF
LASFYRDAGSLEQSHDVLSRAEQHHPKHPKINTGRGMNYLKEGKLENARVQFEAAWMADGDLREAGNNLAWVLQKTDLEESIRIAKEVTNHHPLYATGWDTLGNSCMLAKDWDCAEASFEKALEISPYRVDTYANLGTLFYLQEKWDSATYWWEETLRLSPNHDYATRGLRAIKEPSETP